MYSLDSTIVPVFLTGTPRRKKRGRDFPDERTGYRQREEDEVIYKADPNNQQPSNYHLRQRKQTLLPRLRNL